MTQTSDPSVSWDAWIAVAAQRTAADKARSQVELVLAVSQLVLPDDLPRPRDIPPGQPTRTLTRAVAQQLIELAEAQPDAPEAEVWSTLGRVFRWYKPQEQLDRDLSEHYAAADDLRSALAAVRDPVLSLFVLRELSARERDLFELAESYETSQQLLGVCAVVATLPTSALHRSLPDTTWLVGPQQLASRFLTSAHMRAAIAQRHMRKYEEAISAREDQVRAALAIDPPQPARVADARGNLAALQRATGDISGALATLQEQSDAISRQPDRAARSVGYRSLASQARFLREWDEERRFLLLRLQLEMESCGEGAATSGTGLREAIERLHAKGRQHVLTAMGNCCYELGRNYIDSQAAMSSEDAALESREWLTAAGACWRDVGFNGHIAIRHRLLMLDADKTSDPHELLEIGRRMVQDSRDWRRPAGQRRAAIRAAEYGAPGDPVVLERLEELDVDAPALDHAHLAWGRALWHWGAAEMQLASDDDDTARVNAETALAAGRDAQVGLTVTSGGRSVLLDPDNYVGAVKIQADALALLARTDPPGTTRESPLHKRLECLPAIAQLFAAAGTIGQRKVIAVAHEPWLVETALLAVSDGDADAVDMVSEVARRDLVGLLLRGLATDEEAPEEVAEAARDLTAMFSATLAVDDGGGQDAAQRPDDLTRSAGTLSTQVSRALDVVDGVLGPMGRGLFDPASVSSSAVPHLLEDMTTGRAAAVLSLWLVESAGVNKIVRRLALRTPLGTTHSVDVVDAPEWVLTIGSSKYSDQLFLRTDFLMDVLIPPNLMTELRARTREDPMSLTIVPTGLLGVPFAGLPIGSDRLLVDVAVISMVQSLQTAASLSEARHRWSENPITDEVSVATYDVTNLTHTATELEALLAHFPDTVQVETLDELHHALQNHSVHGAPGLYALALHGQRGADGWSQTKRLPNGDHLTVGHMLQVYFPRLVVGASCNTDIRLDVGELGGFPLAFQLRGAVDVIGTLYDIADGATADILASFYGHVRTGMAPPAALRAAQLEWLDMDRPNRVRQRERWAFLVTYGLSSWEAAHLSGSARSGIVDGA